MDYSTWLMSSSSSLDHTHDENGSTLQLFDDSPVRVAKKVDLLQTSSNEVATSKSWLINDEVGGLLEDLKRVKAENKRLTEMLTAVCENYNELKRQLADYMTKTTASNEIGNANKKRKLEIVAINDSNNNANHMVTVARNNVESSSSDEEQDSSCEKPKEEAIKAKISKVAVRTEASDSSLILKDGYQWRKYGQKVTRDNPCPRAYFKCSFAPTCPVKKKVQRSLEDQSMLVATYEGEHNHAPPSQQEATTSASSRVFTIGSVPCNSTVGATGPLVTLDLTKPKPVNMVANDANTAKMLSNTSSHFKFSSAEFQKILAEQMASSLTKDPNFTSALAAAISGRMVQQSSSD